MVQSEVAEAFAVLHRRFTAQVVEAAPALRDAHRGDLFHDRSGARGGAFDGPRDGDVSERAEADAQAFDSFGRTQRRVQVLAVGEDQPVAPHAVAVVREVEAGQGNAFAVDVGPNVELRPVVQRKHPKVFAGVVVPVEQVPQLGTLVLRIPLSEGVAVGEKSLFRAGLLLVPARASDQGVEAFALDGLQQGGGLEPVATGLRAQLFLNRARVDARLNRPDDEVYLEVLRELVPEFEGLLKVVARIDVHKRHGNPGGKEGFAGQMRNHDGVLPPRKQDARPLKLRSDFPKDVHRFGLEFVQMIQEIGFHRVCGGRVHFRPRRTSLYHARSWM